MKLLITGICGFVGSTIAKAIVERGLGWELIGIDNFCRKGSETNVEPLKRLGVKIFHGDIRNSSDVDALPSFDWLLDAAANPSVLAGADGKTSSRQLMEHNLVGTINMLERCKVYKAGFILLSTSRVYSIKHLAAIPLTVQDNAFALDMTRQDVFPTGLSAAGISEDFPTTAPVSLYGASKLASEALALEYGATFDFPVWINRCGVLAGAGQFGRSDQGIFAFWIHSHSAKKPLKYIGFNGLGYQVRDCLHPRDLASILMKQVASGDGHDKPKIMHFSGGRDSATSLRQMTDWCEQRFGKHDVDSLVADRPFDLPWIALDSSLARRVWGWVPETTREEIFDGIARHTLEHPDWLDLSK